jgi:hypothetical protein
MPLVYYLMATNSVSAWLGYEKGSTNMGYLFFLLFPSAGQLFDASSTGYK